jgi:PAS domain S-box-containing protein
LDFDTETQYLPPPDGDFIASFSRISRCEFDLERKIFSFDRNFGPLIGRPPVSTMTQAEMYDLMTPGEPGFFEMFIQRMELCQTSIIHKELQLKTSDGTFKWFEISARRKKSEHTDLSPVFEGILADISGRRRAVQELTESESWFREVLEESPHSMYRVDYRKNCFDYVSRGFAEALEHTPEEILNMSYSSFTDNIDADDLKKIRQDIAQLYTDSNGKRFTYYCEFRFKLKSGRYVWLDDTFTVVPGPDGQYLYQVGFGSVIEERKNLEKMLVQAKEQLEEKVAVRTAELQEANESLQDLILARRELEREMLEISERERRFIGRELHDGLCQQIVGVQCMFEALRHRLASHSRVVASELKMIRDFMQDAVMQMRNLSRGLCPLSLAPEAVGAALATLAAQTSVLYKIDCRYAGSTSVCISNPDAALHVYRITQEAVQNAIKHGQAKVIQITLTDSSSHLHVNVENDGRPIDKGPSARHAANKREPGSGLGLKLIDYRVGLLGGSWQICNHEGKVRLSINMPVNGDEMQ